MGSVCRRRLIPKNTVNQQRQRHADVVGCRAKAEKEDLPDDFSRAGICHLLMKKQEAPASMPFPRI